MPRSEAAKRSRPRRLRRACARSRSSLADDESKVASELGEAGGRRAGLRVLVLGVGLLFVFATLATCGACGKRLPGGGDTTAARSVGDGGGALPERKAARLLDGSSLRDPATWQLANDGDEEDVATLAVHEGAIGLVEAASEPDLRRTALRAMGYARGWAQVPFLVNTARGTSEVEAKLALEAIVELATRHRRAEDPEDAAELREGCEGLLALARDVTRPRQRRVFAVRALRMLPCPSAKSGEGLPSDVDAK